MPFRGQGGADNKGGREAGRGAREKGAGTRRRVLVWFFFFSYGRCRYGGGVPPTGGVLSLKGSLKGD